MLALNVISQNFFSRWCISVNIYSFLFALKKGIHCVMLLQARLLRHFAGSFKCLLAKNSQSRFVLSKKS